MRVIRCTKFHFSRIKGSWVITISMLNFWTGGGAIELVLETPKLVRSLFIAISTSVPNFIIFPCSLHRAAIDSHWTNIIIIIIIIIIKHTRAIGALALWARPLNIAASSDYRGQAREEQEGRRRAGTEKRQKQNVGWNTDRFSSTKVQNWTEVQTKIYKHTFLIKDEHARKIRWLKQKQKSN